MLRLFTTVVNKTCICPIRKMSNIMKNHGNIVWMDMEMTGKEKNLKKKRIC